MITQTQRDNAGITGRKTIGKRTEPREAFYLQRNSHLGPWWQSSQNKTRNCCNVEQEGTWRPHQGYSPGRLGQYGTCTTFQLQQTGTCQQPQKHFRYNFSSQPRLKGTGGAAFAYDYSEILQE